MKQKFAVQLFTLRKECEGDMPGMLRKLAKMGWAGVETAGLYGHSAEEIAAVLQETGLYVAGMHVSMERLRSELDVVLEEARVLNTRHLICPSVPHELRHPDGYQQLREELNACAKKVQREGYTVSFHNHAFEFETDVGGINGLEYLLEPVPGNAIQAEIDVYWVTKAGRDAAAFLEPYSGRMPTMHLKDMTKDERRTYAEIGEGVIDFVPILNWGERNGVEWYVVEQDSCEGNPLDCVQLSLTNLQRISEGLA
jgi:sugar phosphate isomerase/epimerase